MRSQAAIDCCRPFSMTSGSTFSAVDDSGGTFILRDHIYVQDSTCVPGESAQPLMQYRLPFGPGPSLKT